MTICVEGLLPRTCTVVAPFHEDQTHNEMTYERLVQFARQEGNAFHARDNVFHRVTRGIPAQTNDLNCCRSIPSTCTSPPLCIEKVPYLVGPGPAELQLHIAVQSHTEGGEVFVLLKEDKRQSNITADILPLVTSEQPHGQDEEYFLFANRQQHSTTGIGVEPRAGPFDNQTLPGWISNRALIRWTCYARKYIAPNCDLKMNQHNQVVKNYEWFIAEEKAIASEQEYFLYIQLVKGLPEDRLWKEIEKGAAQKL